MNRKKALIGMSGGVDSSVSAYLAQQAGFECTGATMRLLDGAAPDTDDAQRIASLLGMDFHVLDFRAQFQEKVMDEFARCYEAGLTPNPCIVCNRELKFGVLLDTALEMGCDHVATGHYARIQKNSDGRYRLMKAADEAKDQTYFLYGLTQHQLAHTIFPLGALTKGEARAIAESLGFINARKRDSQDICFIPDGDYKAFLERYSGKCYPAGDFLSLDGTAVGRHSGAVGYTIGQRKGLGLAMGAPVYVCGKNMEENTVTVGPNETLFSCALRAKDWNWICVPCLTAPLRVKAKARSRMTEQTATVYPEENGFCRVVFDEPQRALTPGQAVVLYDGNTVVGGGTITEVL